MQYSHSRKAGNEGDVWKHCVLLAVADTLPLNDEPCYVESHSGAPVHRLVDGGEWQRGIGRVTSSSACVSDYRAVLSPWVRRKEYPASWVMVANRLAGRVNNVTVDLADTSDEVAEAYRQRSASILADNVRVNFHQSDGFELAISADRLDLVFLDPPFSDREREWQRLAGTCIRLRDQGIAFLAWYPYSWHTFPNWIVDSTKCETWEVLWAQCGAKPSQNLKGCGMLVSEGLSAALHKARSMLDPLPACLGWDLRIRQPAA